ncbi:MAG: protein kinase [Planctomycetota bacterium]
MEEQEFPTLYQRLVQERGDPPVLGGVLLSKLLGEGGMGMVFKGFHLRLSIPVAVKIMPALVSGAQTPLLSEARVGARVNHPNVVRVYDLGKEGSFFFMIQEYVEGKTAKEFVNVALNDKPLSEQAVLSIGCDIARGLAAIHAAGYLHRDVKPGNIIISSKDGVAKLLDFGIAQYMEPLLNNKERQKPEHPWIAGTPGYMAPESITPGIVPGPAVDIYGLGVVLYELLAGKSAYETDSTTELLRQQAICSLPDIQTLCPKISSATARIVQRCVKLNPDERFTDANTLLNELAKVLQSFEPSHVVAPIRPELPPVSVACVDDDHEVGEFLRNALEDAGFRVRYYDNPRDGLRGILEEPPDIVITDVQMPDMTGHDVCAAIRANPSVAEVPVVFLTGMADIELIELAMQKGATDYLFKPVNPSDLVARMKCLAHMVIVRREFEALDTQYNAYRNQLKTIVSRGYST